jgi:hypothetical protein
MKSVATQLKRIQDEFLANEFLIADNPDIPLKSMLEIFEKQKKLEALRSWLQNIENVYNPSRVIPPTQKEMAIVR